MFFAKAVVDAERPGFHVRKDAINPWEHNVAGLRGNNVHGTSLQSKTPLVTIFGSPGGRGISLLLYFVAVFHFME